MGKAELKIDADLLAEAQAAGLKVEAIAERAVRVALSQAANAKEREAEAWKAENTEAIADYNRRIQDRGLIGKEFRKW
ncbi:MULTISPECIES: type II toxin-antitoxin system CcdA family antitoxin [Phenylobacterium]|uniref:Type II toxin-antitoxin system CcdA family antitoxin n=1 Tax=Phenylobacterium conjunctum TaxID=1298959 RepID=A0ABW3T6H1_9CAUL